MGNFIELAITPEKIQQSEWENIYFKTLKLIKKYPGMRMKEETYYGEHQKVFSREVETNTQQPKKRSWEICGNYDTREKGRQFSLFYDLNNYRDRGSNNGGGDIEYKDILLRYIEQKDDIVYAFQGITGQKDYHIFILALAILMENELGNKALVTGEFNRKEAEKAVELLRNIIKEKLKEENFCSEIKLPVLVEEKRLISRLFAAYKSDKLEGNDSAEAIIEKAYINYKGEVYRVFTALKQHFSQRTMEEWFKNYVNENFNDSQENKAVKLYMDWLTATKDVDSLIKILCLEKHGPQFDPEKVVQSLAGTWIFLPEKYFDSILTMQEIENDLKQGDNFGKFFNDLWDRIMPGRKAKINLEKEKVFQAIDKYFPSENETLKKEFLQTQKDIVNEMKEMEVMKKLSDLGDGEETESCKRTCDQKKVETADKSPETNDKKRGTSKEEEIHNKTDASGIMSLEEITEYLAKDEEHLDKQDMLDKVLHPSSSPRKILEEEYGERLIELKKELEEKGYNTLEAKKGLLANLIYKGNEVFKEEVWQNIDECESEYVIIFMISVYRVKAPDRKYAMVRRFMMETLDFLIDIFPNNIEM